MTLQSVVALLLFAFGVLAFVMAIRHERRMQRHRHPGVSYRQATLRRDGGWRREDLFTGAGLDHQRQASRFGLTGVVFWIAAIVAWIILAACARPGTAPDPPLPAAATDWELVWSDEFEGPAGAPPDTSRWRADLGDGCAMGICGWGNDEKQTYTDAPENVALDGNGSLAIVARVAPAGLTCHYGPCRYTSAKITTRGRMAAEPGRVAARIRLPTGQGLWPAFWMLGAGYPATPWPQCGELDIMEHKGSQPRITSSAVHGPGYAGATPFADAHALPAGANADDFHEYAVEWDSSRVRFWVDAIMHYTVSAEELVRYGPSVLARPYFVILNLAVGGRFDGDPASDDILPATMLVDYVRVYRPRPVPGLR